LKAQKSKKGWVEAKLKPPAGKRFPTVQHLMLNCRFQSETLLFKYIFHVKQLQGSAISSFGIRTAIDEVEQKLDSSQYLFPGDILNHESLEAAIKEALEVVESRM